MNGPSDVHVDGSGNIYIVDQGNNRIRRVDAATGLISTVAGTGDEVYNGDGIAATAANIYFPSGVHVDGTGNIFIADQVNQRIRRVDAATGLISTVAGTGDRVYNGDGIAATAANIFNPQDVYADGAGNLFIADLGNQRIRRVEGKPQDNTNPACEIVSVDPGPPVTISVMLQDFESGLSHVNVLKAKNATVNIPSFTPGSTDAVLVTAEKID
ncbi:MAG: hypothetical protein AAFP70_21750, partial [Calditrichota bacterium]